jgi:DNA-binding response OmpR family regulator
MLPGMSGLTFRRAIRAESGTPIIMLSQERRD